MRPMRRKSSIDVLVVYRAFMRWSYIQSWSEEEKIAYFNLGPEKQSRFDRRGRRWIYGKIGGPMPLIPGTRRSARPSTDASCTDNPPASES